LATVLENFGKVEIAINNLTEEKTMADDSSAFAEYIRQQGGEDFLRGVVEAVLTRLMDYEVTGQIGAGLHERSGERKAHRNGYRERILHTRLGTLELPIPKLRSGSYFPSFLKPRRLSEKAIAAVVQEAWIGGVSTRKVDDLVQALVYADAAPEDDGAGRNRTGPREFGDDPRETPEDRRGGDPQHPAHPYPVRLAPSAARGLPRCRPRIGLSITPFECVPDMLTLRGLGVVCPRRARLLNI
jgi:hypothetical protein